MIDIHCHLAYEGLNEIADEVIKQSIAAGMKAIITCAYPKDLQRNYELVKKYPGFLYLSVGLHPIDIKDMTQKEIDGYWDWIRGHANEIVAVGEVGLDKHLFPDESLHKRFVEVYVQGLDLAKELKLPVVLHMRKTLEEGFKLLIENNVKQAVFHCYSGNITLAKEIIDNGYLISLATNINHSKNTKTIAKKFPLDKIVTETDSPFLSPIPNQLNVPQNVSVVISKIAEERKMAFEEVAKITSDNAINFFKLGKFLS
jgi:TatD DNase family protein